MIRFAPSSAEEDAGDHFPDSLHARIPSIGSSFNARADAMNLATLSRSGHFAKAFQADRAIPEDQLATLLDFLHSIPSSINAQPTRYVIATSAQARSRIAGTLVEFNRPKEQDASVCIVLATKTSLDEPYLDTVLAKEAQDGRFPGPEHQQRWKQMTREFIAMHRNDVKDLNHWMEKQTYLALGMMTVAAASMGIDCAALEGFDARLVDPLFGFREKGLTTTLLLSLGYRDEARDHAAKLPKSRLPRHEVMTVV